MAISKIIGHINPPKSGWRYKVLQNVINYILNPEKTAGGVLAGSVNCSLDSALQDMISTKEYYGKTSSNRSERLGYHFTISFLPNSINESTAYEIIKEFVEKYLGTEYEAVFAVHNDKEHIHGHICFNSVRFTDGRKYRYMKDNPYQNIKGDWRTIIQPLLDEICLKHGQTTLEMDTGVSIDDWTDKDPKKIKKKYNRRKRNEYYKEKTATYNKNHFIRHDIDDIILRVSSMEEFYEELINRGYHYKFGNSKEHGPYLSVLPPTFPRYRKTYQLGDSYTLEAIEKRIKDKRKPLPILPYEDKELRFYVPVNVLRFQYTRYMKKTEMYPALKYYYAKLYRLGVKPSNKKSNYITAKEILKEIRCLEKQMELVYTKQITNVTACQLAIADTMNNLKKEEEALNTLAQNNKPFIGVVRAYKQTLNLKSYTYLSAEQQQQLQDCMKIIKSSDKTEAELQDYIELLQSSKKGINKRRKTLNEELIALNAVYKRFNDGKKQDEQPAIEKDFKDYQRVQLQYMSQNELIRNQGRERNK